MLTIPGNIACKWLAIVEAVGSRLRDREQIQNFSNDAFVIYSIYLQLLIGKWFLAKLIMKVSQTNVCPHKWAGKQVSSYNSA